MTLEEIQNKAFEVYPEVFEKHLCFYEDVNAQKREGYIKCLEDIYNSK